MMLNPTCSQCLLPLTARDAMLIMSQVVIWLQCDNGHETVKIVPVSRFVKVPLGKKESTLGKANQVLSAL